jgi:SAM-dependent methyltransferase
MSHRKLTSEEAEAYWQHTHREANSDLQAVCSPNQSPALNAFFDRIQRYAVVRALAELELGGPNTRVLEIGCGRGRWLRLFRDRGATGTGIDLSAEAIARCLEQGLTAVVGSAEKLPFATGSFDLVISVTVLLHLPPEGQRKAAAEMQRVCRAGGHVVLLEGSAIKDPAPHVWSRPARDWIRLFDKCRPVLVESHYFNFALRLLWALPIGRAPRRLRAAAEQVAVRLAWPLELALMSAWHRRRTRGALQALIVLRNDLTARR